jgi:hypothetical protein
VQRFEYTDRAPINLLDGRFGLYLSDGELNAYLRREDNAQALDAASVRNIFEERGKPPKAKAAKASSGKTSKKVAASPKPAKATTKSKASSSKKPVAKKKAATKTAKADAPAKEKPVWADLEPFTKEFDPTTAQLLKLINGERIPMADAAQKLRISQEDAMSRYRASNFKLYNLYRKAKA